MEIKWEYSLPTDMKSDDYMYESPILEHGDYIYFVCKTFSHNQTKLYVINKETGVECCSRLIRSANVLPSRYFFFSHNDKAVLYTGDLHFVQNDKIIKTFQFHLLGKIDSYLYDGKYLYASFSDNRRASLCCFDLNMMSSVWSIDISSSSYTSGELSYFDNLISCFGRNQLLFISPETGEIIDAIKIPRIEKLYCPIRVDDDSILIGYTNWTTAGILKYQLSTKKVLWRHKRKFEGPQLHCKIYRYQDGVFWVKNDTELICLDIETGEEKYNLRTNPWLYTDLHVYQGGILYGTAGANGYMYYLNCEMGELTWSEFIENGCAYYGIWNNSVYIGDFDKKIRQICIADGKLISKIDLDGDIVGQIYISGGYLYTVIWGNKEKDIRLIRIQINN